VCPLHRLGGTHPDEQHTLRTATSAWPKEEQRLVSATTEVPLPDGAGEEATKRPIEGRERARHARLRRE
jgi:hypothetical protein